MSHVNNLLKELELKGALNAWESMNVNPQSMESLTIEDILETILVSEQNIRSQRRQDALLKVSKLPLKLTQSDIDYSDERGIDFKKTMNALTTLDFIKKGQNVCIFGGSGSGKTHIACALGTLACLKGYSTKFFTVTDLVDSLIRVKGSNAYSSKRNTIKKTSLIIIDDFCLFTKYTEEQINVLFEILNDRYQYKSIIITSQKTPDLWVKDLGGTAIAEAIVERIATNNFDLLIKGQSRRTSLQI